MSKANAILKTALAGILLCGFTGWAGTALAVGNSVSYSNGIDPPIAILDNSPGDLNPAIDEIEVHFSLADGVNDDWVASGVILATTTNPLGATLVVTGTTIQNVSGNQIIAAQIIINHDFPPFVSLTQQYTAHIDGSFDKLGGGYLGNFILNFNASMTGSNLGGQNFADGLVDYPILFAWTGMPYHQDTIIQQTQDFIFYMDEIDNTINLFDSATILPTQVVGEEASSWGGVKSLYR